MTILQNGEQEGLKAALHAAAAGLFAVFALYNGAAWLVRPKREPKGHLALNAVVYAGLCVWELDHVMSHLNVRP